MSTNTRLYHKIRSKHKTSHTFWAAINNYFTKPGQTQNHHTFGATTYNNISDQEKYKTVIYILNNRKQLYHKNR